MKITWNIKDVIIKEVSTRQRKDEGTDNVVEYKVVKFCQKMDEHRTCLCFDKRIERMIGVGQFCNLEGEITFGQGSTYLVVRKLERPGDLNLVVEG